MTVVLRQGTAAELHELDPFDVHDSAAPWLLVCEVVRRAVVLGSRQEPSVLDLAACDVGGYDVARRRSGGGVVVLRPGEVIWVDIVVPRGAPGVPDDVRGSMEWAGERWAAALRTGELEVHRGGIVPTAWSDLLCFAGLGPGEVLRHGRKLVGLSQRRTRHGARIQGLVHRRARADDDVALLARPHPPGSAPAPATLPDLATDDLVGVMRELLE